MLDEESASAAAERWKIAAFQLACESGLAALSTRALANRMGGSPSAINYHFGNREQLISEICGQAAAASSDWRKRRQAQTAMLMPIWGDLAGAFTAILQARLEESRNLLVLLRELEQEASANGLAGITQILAGEAEAEAAFWHKLAADFGAEPGQAELWADLALALTSMCLSLPSAAHRSVWISGPAVRLQQRLAREPIALHRGRSGTIDDFDASPGHHNETAARILDAALAAIADKGADRLNQREVAARAGVSLSAVTYFFGAKHELIQAAFEELCRRDYRAMTSEQSERNRNNMLLTLSAAESRKSLAAMEVLWRAGLRHPAMAPTVNRMLTIRGVGSEALLARLGFEVDRLDGYLWISMVTGHYRRVYNLSPEIQQEALHDAALRRLTQMFGDPDPMQNNIR